MKEIISILVFIFLIFTNRSYAETKIINTGVTQKVNIDKPTMNLIKAQYPGASIVKDKEVLRDASKLFPPKSGQTPMGQSADFTGDGSKDFAFVIKSKGHFVYIAILNDKQTLSIHELDKISFSEFKKNEKLDIYLSLPGKDFLKHRKGTAKRQAIQIEKFLGSTKAYYFDGKKFQVYEGKAI